MNHTGQGVPQDFKQALKWYRLAAQQGDATAQFNLGVMYRRGVGAPQDDRQAFKWYRLAAEQGDANAQFNLGAMYYLGASVAQDYYLGSYVVILGGFERRSGSARAA